MRHFYNARSTAIRANWLNWEYAAVTLHKSRMRWMVMAALVPLALSGGCVTGETHPTLLETTIALKPGDLQRAGMAFITPSTVTGQEQGKQALALIFADVIANERPGLHIVRLPETLGAINRAGLADEYRRMFDNYRDSGIFNRDMLQKIGTLTGARYLMQLKLAGFSQDTHERFSVFGFRVVQTLQANIRLFVQIWDSTDGTIAWEAVEELNSAYDTVKEQPVSFRAVVTETARHLTTRLP